MDSGVAGVKFRRGNPPADLRAALEAVGIAVFDWHVSAREMWISAGVEQLLGEIPAVMTVGYRDRILHPEDAHLFEEHAFVTRAQVDDRFEFEARMRAAPDAWRWIRVRAKVLERSPEGVPLRLVGTLSDATASKTTEQKLQERLELEALVVLISTEFLNQPIDEVDHCVVHALQAIGEFTGIDHAHVFQLGEGGTVAVNTHEWCASGIPPQQNGLQAMAFERDLPGFTQRIRRREIVKVPDVAALPAELERERCFLASLGIQSLICVPMVCRDVLLGFVGFNTVRSRQEWRPEVVTLLQMVTDIFASALDRRQRQHFLQESEAKIRALIDGLPDAMFVFDRSLRVVDYHAPRPTQSPFQEPEAVLGKNLAEIVPPSIFPQLATNFASLFATGHSVNSEYAIELPDGTRHLDVRTIRYQPDLALCVVRDLTARKQAEKAIRQSEERYRQLAEMLPEIVFEMLPNGRVSFANRAGMEKFGYCREDLERGVYLHEVLAPEDHARAGQALADLLASGAMMQHEYTALTKDGRRFPVLAYASRNVQGGQVLGLRGIIVDITERKRAEEERSRLEQQLQQTQKLESLGVLASGIAHDLNNLLTGVLGNASLALVDLPSHAPARASIEQIEAVALQAAGLAQQMLAYSGKSRLASEVLLLPAVIQEMRYLLGSSVSKRCQVSYHFAPEVPPLEGDLSQLRQVIMNLVINASEAIGDKDGTITVGVRPVVCDGEYLRTCQYGNDRAPGTYVALEVLDTGCGIEPEVLGKMFDPFFSTKFLGRGLGLAAVRGVMQAHAGAIRVTSVVGQGTTIEVLFPASSEQPTLRSPPPRTGRLPRYGGAALIIDDEEMVLSVARQMFERMGFEVLTALDGKQGIELLSFHAEEIRLVLLDRTMPRMDGIETLAQLRRIRGDVPVIMASGFTQEDAASWTAGARPDAFLNKPYSLEVLAEAVARVLGRGA